MMSIPHSGAGLMLPGMGVAGLLAEHYSKMFIFEVVISNNIDFFLPIGRGGINN